MANSKQVEAQLLVSGMFQPALPPRHHDSHKGTFGSIAIIGGDEGMVGALLLAARAALLAGAGRVYVAPLCKNAPTVDMLYPEIMVRSPAVLAAINQLNCVVIGPGLGQSDEAMVQLEFWLSQALPILLDADALNLIATHPDLAKLVKNRQAETVVTPHVGEAARLLNRSTEAIQNNRVASALELAKSLNVICVLKGAGTICAQDDDHCFMNTTGNPALATGGTGDVLSGVIGSLIAQGLAALDATKLGVYVHGAAADALVASSIGPVGVTASQVSKEVPNVINQLNKAR